MKEDICSIPVNEVFEVADGCPVCRMHETLEEHLLEFIMGPAMMEPDIRTETNKTGFCPDHMVKMLGRKNRLGLALMLETRLQTIDEAIFKPTLLSRKSKAEKAADASGGCYVCEKVDKALEAHMVTVFKLWKKEAEFRASVASQPIICLPHYKLLLTKAAGQLDKKQFAEFETVLSNVMQKGLKALEEDVTGFCRMYDYRSNGAEWGNKKDAPERAVAFLSGFKKA